MTQTHRADVPRRVLLFSGHMIDAPDRDSPRFPADRQSQARNAIEALLDGLGADPGDSAICGGACGGDLIFAEACLARGVALELYLPFDEATFLANSVDFADADWNARFHAVKSRAVLHVLPAERPALTQKQNPYEQNNLWMLESANRFGAHRVEFVCLWDGQGGDGPGGTQHLMQAVEQSGGRVHWLDTTQLFA